VKSCGVQRHALRQNGEQQHDGPWKKKKKKSAEEEPSPPSLIRRITKRPKGNHNAREVKEEKLGSGEGVTVISQGWKEWLVKGEKRNARRGSIR